MAAIFQVPFFQNLLMQANAAGVDTRALESAAGIKSSERGKPKRPSVSTRMVLPEEEQQGYKSLLGR